MKAREFRQLIAQKTDSDLLGICLRDATTPFVFDPKPPTWEQFRSELASLLGIESADITVVGSARLGFSLKPNNNLKSFTDKSDIDVVVVDAGLFDRLWYDLLLAAYPRPPVTSQVGGWLRDRQKELYTGWLSPLEVKLDRTIFGSRATSVLDFRTHWFNSFKKASRHPPRRYEDITGRLYRTWEHAELYHLNSIAALRRTLLE